MPIENYAHLCCGSIPSLGHHTLHSWEDVKLGVKHTGLPGYGFYCETCKKSVSVLGGSLFALEHWNLSTPKGDCEYVAGELQVTILILGSTYNGRTYVVIEDTSKAGDLWPEAFGDNGSRPLKEAKLLNPVTGNVIIADIEIGHYWNKPERVLIRCRSPRGIRKSEKLVKEFKDWISD